MNSFTESVKQILIDNYIPMLYIIPIIVLLCVIIIYFSRWRDYRLPQRIAKRKVTSGADTEEKIWPKLSIIVPANEQADLLAVNLPKLLDQVYPNFEVIVVDETSTDETAELIKQLQLKYRNLRRTFVPLTATDICKRKLSITLGVRAARSEWAIITTAAATPVSRLWLQKIAEEIEDGVDIIMGYSNYQDDDSDLSHRAIFERFWNQLRCFSAAEKGIAIGGDETCFCVRKSAFLDHKGYADKLQNDFGESHLLIQTLAEKNNTRLALAPEAKITEELPIDILWRNSRIYFRETLRHSSKKTHLYLLREGIASSLIFACIFCFCMYIAIRCFQLLSVCDYNLNYLYIDGIMLVLLASFVILPLSMFRRCTTMLNEQISIGRMMGYALTRPFTNLSLKCQRWKLRKEFARN